MESLLNILYLLGYAIAFSGLAYQTYHVYKHKYIRGFTMIYALSLITAKCLAVPRAVMSTYWVWWVQEGIATMLTLAFVIGILLYGKQKKEAVKNDT